MHSRNNPNTDYPNTDFVVDADADTDVWRVICKNDDGVYVPATIRKFAYLTDAETYARSVCASRDAIIFKDGLDIRGK